MFVSLIIPTRNRSDALHETATRIERLDPAAIERAGGVELVIADNNSHPPARVPRRLINGIPVSTLRLPDNLGTAARNDAARIASGQWVLMLDDDSSPVDAGFLNALKQASPDTAALCADIWLPPTDALPARRESGGLPEVPVGCGVAYRRDVYNALNGYDPTFLYYAEEYDLAARLIAAGHRIVHDHRFIVEHRKVAANRSFGDIVERLLLNNASVWQRYAPDAALQTMIDRDLKRLESIARRESHLAGYKSALRQLDGHLSAQRRTPLVQPHFDRLIGLDAARRSLATSCRSLRFNHARLWLPDDRPGKHPEEIRQALEELGIDLIDNAAPARKAGPAILPGTLAPGPMLDAADQLRAMGHQDPIVLPWQPGHFRRPPDAMPRAAA